MGSGAKSQERFDEARDDIESVVNPSLDGKIYYVKRNDDVIVYDPRDGTWNIVETQYDQGSKNMCVIDNVIYVYNTYSGLLWYDSNAKDKRMRWKHVNGLSTTECCSYYMGKKTKGCQIKIAMSQYNG